MSARRPLLIAAAVFVAVLASRLPFMTTHLWAWDSTLYARALDEGFYVTADPATQRPHPPGYIWYVALAALVRAVTTSDNTALVVISVASAAAGAAVLYLIARRYVRDGVALVAALAYAASPVVWMYSEVAYPYTLLALLSLALGWSLVEGRRPVAQSLALGVLSGFRQDLLLLLLPLWLWRVTSRTPATAAASAVALGVGALVWLVPSALLSGGPAAYLGSLVEQSGTVTGASLPSGGASVVAENVVLEGEPLVVGMALLGLLLVADGLWALWRLARGERLRLSRLGIGIALWVCPALAFYTFVHIGEWGYVLSVMPPLVLTAAMRADRMVGRIPSLAWPVVGAVTIVIPLTLFIATDIRFSASQLRERDASTPMTQCCRTLESRWD